MIVLDRCWLSGVTSTSDEVLLPDGASEGVGMYAVVMFLMVPVDVTVMAIDRCVVVVDVALVWPTASNYQTTVTDSWDIRKTFMPNKYHDHIGRASVKQHSSWDTRKIF